MTAGTTVIAGPEAESFFNLDTVDYGAMTYGVTLEVFSYLEGPATGLGAAAGDLLYNIHTLLLTNYEDVVTLANQAFSGEDVWVKEINLRGGADLLNLKYIGFGDFKLGSGSDTVTGSQTSGLIDLGAGDDQLTLESYIYEFHKDSAPPMIVLGRGGQDHFTMSGGHVGQVVDGGRGDDTITGWAYFGTFSGGTGRDVITLETHAYDYPPMAPMPWSSCWGAAVRIF